MLDASPQQLDVSADVPVKLHSKISKPLLLLNLLLTYEEILACKGLCRLDANIGFWVIWLPVGTSISSLPIRRLSSVNNQTTAAWAITMAYHANDDISAEKCIRRALEYVPLCFVAKSLVSARLA